MVGAAEAVGIDAMRRALRASAGDMSTVGDDVLGLWRATLERNYRNWDGMREVMLRVAG